MARGLSRRRFALAVLLTGGGLVGMAATAAAQTPGGDGRQFDTGEILVALGDGSMEWHALDGSLIRSLPSGGSAQLAGMAFAPDGSLLVTHFSENRITRLSASGQPLGDFGAGFNTSPESIAIDTDGNVYVGQADGSGDILKFSPEGALLQAFDVATDSRGSDWIDLLGDQCTMLYTSEGTVVLRYDVCADEQREPFATGLPGSAAYAVRALPDGGALVADDETIVRLDGSGRVVREYDAPGQDDWFALNLDPSGDAFWSAGLLTSDVYRFDLDSGQVTLQFETASGSIGGVAVNGEITVAQGSTGGFTGSLFGPGDIQINLGQIAANVAVTTGIVLFIPFPAELFNNTLEKHYEEVTGWFRRRRPGAEGRRRSRLATVPRLPLLLVVSAVTAVMYCLLDPSFGFSVDSLAVFAGIFSGLLVMTLLFSLFQLLFLRVRKRSRGVFRVFPGSVPLAVVCVVLSRVAKFVPGYLYGLTARHTPGEDVAEDEEARMVAVRSVSIIAVVIGAWFARVPIHTRAVEDGSFPFIALDALLVVMVVSGLEGLAFGMLPLSFMDGNALYHWSRRVWAVIYGVAVLGFVYILLNPQSGYLTRASALITFVLFGVFGFASVAFWGYFRYRRPKRPPQDELFTAPVAPVTAAAPPPVATPPVEAPPAGPGSTGPATLPPEGSSPPPGS